MNGDQNPLDSIQNLSGQLDVQFALQATGLGVWELNTSTMQVILDDRCRELFGLATDNVLPYEQSIQYIHPEDVEHVSQAVQRALTGESNGNYDQTYRTIGADDGQLRWVRVHGRAYFSETGDLYRFAGVAQDVTQQLMIQQQEAATRQQSQQQQRIYEAITSSTPDLMYVFDLNYRFTYANQALLAMWGKSWENSIGNNLLENGYEPWHAQMHEREIDQVVATKQSIRGEVSFPHATLGRRIYDYVFAPVLNDKGDVEAVAGTTRDITDIRRAQELTQQSEARFRSLIEEAPVATAVYTGPELVVEIANERMIRFFGRGPSILGKPIRQILTAPGDLAAVALLEQVFTSGKAHDIQGAPAELTIDGLTDTYYFDLSLKPLRNAAGEVYAIIQMAVEVTEQANARQRLEESEARFINIIQQSPAATLVLRGDDFVIDQINTSMMTFIGRGEEVIGQPLLTVIPELEGQFAWQQVQRVYHEGVSFEQNEVLVAHNRTGVIQDYYYNLAYRPLRERGQITGMIQVVTDVTEQKLDRRRLEESEARFRTLLEASPQITWTNTPQGEINFYNGRWYAYTGLSVEQTRDHGLQAVVHPDDLVQTIIDYQHGLTTGEEMVFENRYRRADGQYRWHLNRALPLRDEAGTIVQWVGTATDIHQQKQLEAGLEEQVQVRTAQLQASVADLRRSNENLQQFAYIASHDLQEPLRKIQSFGDVLKTQYGEQLGEGVGFLERMQSAASRMSTLIKDLLAYSRISTHQETTTPIVLNKVISDVLTDLDFSIQETGAQVTVEPLPTIPGDKSQLGQLFQNLLSNALKFRQPDTSPTIRISCRQVTAADLPASVRPTRVAGAYYQIEVADNGIGFDNKYVDRIFQLFQRLHGKSEFAGTGIGLAICEKVVANHGGAITATSQPGQGATFTIYLPA